MLVFNHYIISHKHDRLTVMDSETNSALTFAPGECATITSLVAQAVGFLDMPALPEKVASGPFEVHFSDTGKCVLLRTDGEGHLEFTASSHDDIIKTIDMLLNNYTDVKRLKVRGKGQRFGTNYPDPQF